MQTRPRAKGWRELPVLVVVALLLAILVKTFLVQAFFIPSGSMEKTLHGCPGCNGDRVLVNKVIYKIRDIHRGFEEIQPPVELVIPDYRELEFARCGFIPLIHKKGTGDATFFSVQAVKRSPQIRYVQQTVLYNGCSHYTTDLARSP